MTEQSLGASANAETGPRASTMPASGHGPTGFDPARIADLLKRFEDALFEQRWVADLIMAGEQFNCYERGGQDDDLDDDEREYRLCIGPVSNARLLFGIEGRATAEMVEAAMKLATDAFRASITNQEQSHD